MEKTIETGKSIPNSDWTMSENLLNGIKITFYEKHFMTQHFNDLEREEKKQTEEEIELTTRFVCGRRYD